MDHRSFPILAATCVAAAMLSACGGGGDKPADVNPSTTTPVPQVVSAPNSFLLFPNPQRQDDKTLQTDTNAYAVAYYASIDPQNERDTFAKWKAANRFDQPGISQTTAVFGDFRDLGYGRRMTGRMNNDGTIAFYVENYLVDVGGGGGYASSLNIEAAIVRDQRWLANINAIEYVPGPGGTVKFAKFYSFDPVSGARMLRQDIDGRGLKAMPSLCISCHGGRGDALEANQSFRLLANSEDPGSAQRGDARGRFHVFEADALTFSNTVGYTRAEQEAAIKALNKIVLCTYPIVGGPPPAPSVNACRPTASVSDWQGVAADLLQANYGGAELPRATYADDYVPNDWSGHASLYRNVVVPACRSCHIVRGTLAPNPGSEQPSDIDFTRFATFDSYADRIKVHVYDRGNMPLARIVYEKFWNTGMAEQLAAYLQSRGDPLSTPARDSMGRLLQPGRPIADPGPDRVVPLGTTRLSAENSLFANSYQWRIVTGAGATLAGANSATPTLTAMTDALLVTLELTASQGSSVGTPVRMKVLFKATAPDPATLTFTNIKDVFAANGGLCLNCHSGTTTPRPPTLFNTADDAKLYSDVRSLINFTDIVDSPLLRKPSGHHHNGAKLTGFDETSPLGDNARNNYDLFVGWIVNGARRN